MVCATASLPKRSCDCRGTALARAGSDAQLPAALSGLLHCLRERSSPPAGTSSLPDVVRGANGGGSRIRPG
jgi:hypothetical protein